MISSDSDIDGEMERFLIAEITGITHPERSHWDDVSRRIVLSQDDEMIVAGDTRSVGIVVVNIVVDDTLCTPEQLDQNQQNSQQFYPPSPVCRHWSLAFDKSHEAKISTRIVNQSKMVLFIANLSHDDESFVLKKWQNAWPIWRRISKEPLEWSGEHFWKRPFQSFTRAKRRQMQNWSINI